MSETITATVTLATETITSTVVLGERGPAGKSAYQSYLETTTDDPPMSEAEWSEGGGGGVSSWNDLTDKPSTFPPIIGSGADQAVAGNDARLTDARTPTAHTHPWSEVTDKPTAFTPEGHTHNSADITDGSVAPADNKVAVWFRQFEVSWTSSTLGAIRVRFLTGMQDQPDDDGLGAASCYYASSEELWTVQYERGATIENIYAPSSGDPDLDPRDLTWPDTNESTMTDFSFVNLAPAWVAEPAGRVVNQETAVQTARRIAILGL